jgi:predicted O-methyltransferase YrrM
VNTTTPPYDLVFLDADKPSHRVYLDILLSRSKPGDINRLIRIGALIVVDNTLRFGDVVELGEPNPNFASAETWRRDVEAVRSFNDCCMKEERLEIFLVPLWDGVSVLRLRD